MKKSFYASLENELEKIREEGLFKEERFIASPQKTRVELANGNSVLNFCANDYLGLANNLDVKKAASESVEKDGFGMASVRFICGTNDKHRQLEEKLSSFLGYEDCILYVACFDANGGLFEPLFDENDAIISDALNHASIIDGIRLCKAKVSWAQARAGLSRTEPLPWRTALRACGDAGAPRGSSARRCSCASSRRGWPSRRRRSRRPRRAPRRCPRPTGRTRTPAGSCADSHATARS